MAISKRISCVLLCVLFCFEIIPLNHAFAVVSRHNAALSDVQIKKTDILYNASEFRTLEFVFYENKYYLPITEICALAGYDKTNEDEETVTIRRGYRQISIENSGKMFDNTYGNDEADLLFVDGIRYLEAIPMLGYLGAEVKSDDNGMLRINTEIATIWDVIGSVFDFNIDQIDINSLYEDGQQAIKRKVWCDQALDLLDKANGEGLGGLFGGHVISALEDALKADCSDYSYVAEQEYQFGIRHYFELSQNDEKTIDPKLLKMIGDCISKGKTEASNIEDMVELELNLIELYDFSMYDQLREAFSGTEDFAHLNDLAHKLNNELSDAFCKIQDTFERTSDYFTVVKPITGIIAGCYKNLGYSIEARTLLSETIDSELVGYLKETFHGCQSWTVFATLLGNKIKDFPSILEDESIKAASDFVIGKLESKGIEGLLDQIVGQGYGGLTKAIVDVGWLVLSWTYSDQLEAVSDDLDAIHLAVFTRDILTYAIEYTIRNKDAGLRNENTLRQLRKLCVLGYRCGLSFAENYSNSLANLFSSKAQEYAALFGGKTNNSVANNMAKCLWFASNCRITPTQSLSVYFDDISAEIAWRDVASSNEDLNRKTTIAIYENSVYAIREDNSLWKWNSGFYRNEGQAPAKVLDDAYNIVRCDYSGTYVLDSDNTLWKVDSGATEILKNVRSVESVFAICTDNTLWQIEPSVKRIMDGVVSVADYYYEYSGYSEYNNYAFVICEDASLRNTKDPTVKLDENVRSFAYCCGMCFTIHNDGSLWAWGKGEFSADFDVDEWSPVDQEDIFFSLGNGTTEGSEVPVEITNHVSSIVCTTIGMEDGAMWSIVYGCTCYLIKEDGSLWGWGYNKNYNLGDGTSENRTSPVKILDNTMDFAFFGNAFARTKDGAVWSWGENNSEPNNRGLLGQGNVQSCDKPKRILDDVSRIWTLYGDCAYALKNDGTLWGWGYSTRFSPLGNGDTEVEYSPVLIARDVKNVAYHAVDGELIAASETYIIKEDNSLWGWGYGGDYRNDDWAPVDAFTLMLLGDGSRETRYSPVLIMGNVAFMISSATSGWDVRDAVVIDTNGTVWSWGFNGYADPEMNDWCLSPEKVFEGVKLP